MKKTLATIALAGSIALIGAFPAVAADKYPAPPANAAVSDGVVGPGADFVFRGKGFKAGEGLVIKVTPGTKPASTGASVNGRGMSVTGKITLPLAPQQLSAKADANGAFALPLSISEPGVYTITATGLESGVTATSSITVEGAAVAPASTTTTTSTSTSGLANTGADSNLMIWSLVGAGALAAGATSVVVVRRRAKAEVAA
ncbi:LPXTG cell wall anchor domain-containing protein [Arthrobacter sp. LAR12-1-1.1]|uniref:LPXTG cell wall anchor domain-containing protein n=1 Tax=Arthrobacter sp. LAR12-1-1.1 TaxID=3135215 RepID=UPI003425EEA3